MANMLGIGTSEYDKRIARPVHLRNCLTMGGEDNTQISIHTIQQSKTSEGNLVIQVDIDIWEKKRE